jgi:hypothetical protein
MVKIVHLDGVQSKFLGAPTYARYRISQPVFARRAKLHNFTDKRFDVCKRVVLET